MELTLPTSKDLMAILEARFEKNPTRHENLTWKEISDKLENNPELLKKIAYLEATQGEPDAAVINDQVVYVDFSKETPKGRKSLCYDQAARLGRKKFPPVSSVIEECEKWGVELLTEAEYRQIQALENLDLKTSSWIKTPAEIRDLGGALFCDNRYDHIFVYHNGADSYYASRAFRAKIIL